MNGPDEDRGPETGKRPESGAGFRGLKSEFRGSLVSVRWRWRRFILRYEPWLVIGMLALAALGVWLAEDLYSGFRGTVFSGNAPVRGQVIVRPPVNGGVVRNASVHLIPAGPSRALSGLVAAAGGGTAQVVHRTTDNAGRWSSGHDVSRGWRYAVMIQAEGCPTALAGTVDIGWISAHRVDLMMRSCVRKGPASPLASRPLAGR